MVESHPSDAPGGETLIVVGRPDSAMLEAVQSDAPLGDEGYAIIASRESVTVAGQGDSGVLYGCGDLARRIRRTGELPVSLRVIERPSFRVRGTCIGLQKPNKLPGREIYEYPLTDELFPFFYDRAGWIEYLDFLVERRMNLLSLWNGHPFGSLVRLKDYPDAVEVSPEQFARNVETYRFITREAEKRGIWVTQMFYNILLPAPLARQHGVSTQLSEPTPLAADYTRKAVAEFVRMYPNVGLHVCLGEALLDVPSQRSWLVDVILPGVRDGLRQAGVTEEPPVMLRAHATDPEVVIPAALAVYSNIFTESKYNGESLTTWRPRGAAQQTHRELASLGSTHVVNVHILANLEPFRYGAQRFIKRSTLASRDRLGAGGLHVYPLSYWNWPDAPDLVDPPLRQIERDWMWFDAWARYAWNPDVSDEVDQRYWIERHADRFGREAAPFILDAVNDAGECAPRLIRRLGITEGNRQTLSLGMTLEQLTDPQKYNAYPDLWLSQAPPGERLDEFVRREWDGLPHEGETPIDVASEAVHFASRAVKAMDAAAEHVTRNHAEFDRLHNDCRCILAMSLHYQAKTNAARLVLRHRRSGAGQDLLDAARSLDESVEHYRQLVDLTDEAYRFANSMQIGHRRIPYRGAEGGAPAFYHWRQVLPRFETEALEFRRSLPVGDAATTDAAPSGGKRPNSDNSAAFAEAEYALPNAHPPTYRLAPGDCVFSDRPAVIKTLVPELVGLKAVRTPYDSAAAANCDLEIDLSHAARILVGYFRTTEPGWRRPPNPDIDARAYERDEVEPLLTDAVVIEGMPPVDVYAFTVPQGLQRWKPPGAGRYL
ncbi:MAG: hypothetical protein KDA61_10650, partial [Planctomycetales bacterium]|nr:hypothetical protein [Planctomycetales bacterium]